MTRKLISAAMTVAIGIGGAASAAAQDPPQPQQPQPEQRQTDRKPADQAQDMKSRGTGAVAGLSKDDQRFIQEAAEGGKAEVALGNLALQRAASDDVKQFAQHMVDDHSKANQELTELASQKNISLPHSSDVKAATGGVKDTVAGVHDAARDPRAVAKEGHTQADQQTASGRPATGGAATMSGDSLTGKHRQLYDRLSRLSGAEFDREVHEGDGQGPQQGRLRIREGFAEEPGRGPQGLDREDPADAPQAPADGPRHLVEGRRQVKRHEHDGPAHFGPAFEQPEPADAKPLVGI